MPVPAALENLRVVGLGGCGMDMLAQVGEFPAPDSKVRTTGLLMAGGGNTANTLTGVRRLGLPVRLLTKVGDDVNGGLVLEELERDGVDTAEVVRAEGVGTGFTYVIVEAKGGTRTCIHTAAGEELRAGEVAGRVEEALEGAVLLVLDGRHMSAAVVLARAAVERGVPVLVDVEREREGLAELLGLADYVVGSEGYWMVAEPAAANRVDAMTRLLMRGRVKGVICTKGERGSTMAVRAGEEGERGRRDKELLVTRERMAAEVVGRYGAGRSRGGVEKGEVEILECPAWPVAEVVDSCGAGDAFIAGVAYGIAVGLGVEGWLGLGTRVAARQIGSVGARTGLPRREELDESLLTPLPRL